MSDRKEAPKWQTALILCLVVGVLGAHRFYVGKTKSGILQLCTLGGFGLWSTWDLIQIFLGKFETADGKLLTK